MNIVIIGAGIAAFSVVQSLRRLNANYKISVITACNADQYYKPNLSQALSCKIPLEKLTTTKAEEWTKKYDVTLFSKQNVSAIDVGSQMVYFADSKVAYDKLVLATGAGPVDIPGCVSNEIFHLNSLQSYKQLHAALAQNQKATIIGAGLVGCELASDLARSEYEAHLLYPQDEPLMKLFPEALCRYVKCALEAAGVICSSNRKVIRIDNSNSKKTLQFSDGSSLYSSVVVNCAGLRPGTQLAKSAGLAVNNGIVTDSYLQTSHRNIFAIGDCAEINGALHQYIAPIIQSARALASTLCGVPVDVSLGNYPVAVKIQQMPLLFTMKDKAVEWVTEEIDQGMIAKGLNSQGQLAAYALAGKAQQYRSQLSAEIVNQSC